MKKIRYGIGLKALAVSSVLLVGGCANGQAAEKNIKDHRERVTVVQENNIEEKDIDQVVGLLHRSETLPAPTNVTERLQQQGDLDVLFETCPRMFEGATDAQKQRLTNAVKSLFENNSFASNYASHKPITSFCGVDIAKALGRN
ncbi:MAG: hypothetical protein U0R17_04660 [Acidimicrobiia bacterium]